MLIQFSRSVLQLDDGGRDGGEEGAKTLQMMPQMSRQMDWALGTVGWGVNDAE